MMSGEVDPWRKLRGEGASETANMSWQSEDTMSRRRVNFVLFFMFYWILFSLY